MAAGGRLAVTTGLSAGPDARTVVRSAPPTRSPWSDGLMGEASIRTTTSSGFGSGVAMLASAISTKPSFVTVERSWSPMRVSVSAMCGLRSQRRLAPFRPGR